MEPPVIALLLLMRQAVSASPDLSWPAENLTVSARSGGGAAMAGRIAKKRKNSESRNRSGVAALQADFIGGHRAIECEEIGILAVGFGEQTVAFGIAGAAGLLAVEWLPR